MHGPLNVKFLTVTHIFHIQSLPHMKHIVIHFEDHPLSAIQGESLLLEGS